MAIGNKETDNLGIPSAPAPSLDNFPSLPGGGASSSSADTSTTSSSSRLESANTKLAALKEIVQASNLGKAFQDSQEKQNTSSDSVDTSGSSSYSDSGPTSSSDTSSDSRSTDYEFSEPIDTSPVQEETSAPTSQEEALEKFNEDVKKAYDAFRINPEKEKSSDATEGPMQGRRNASFTPDYTNFYGGQTFEGQNAGRANHGFNGDFVYNGYYVDESDNKVFPQTDEAGNITGFVDEKGEEVTSGVRIIDGATEWADNDWAAFTYLSDVLDGGGWIDPDTAYGCQQLAANLSYDYTKLGDYWRGQLEEDKKDFEAFDFDSYSEDVSTPIRDAWLARQKDMADYITWLDGMSDASKDVYDIFVKNNSIYSQYDDDKLLTQDQINQQVLEAAQAANQFGTFTDEEIQNMMNFTDADWENFIDDHKNEPHNAQNSYTQKAWENKGVDIDAVRAAITAAKENANYINDKVAIGRNYISMGNSVEDWQTALATLDPNSPNFEHERRFIQEKIDGIRAYDIGEQYKSVSSEDIRKEIFEMKYGKGASDAESGPSYEESYALAMEKRDAYNDAVRKLDELSKTTSHTSREYLDAYQAVKDAKAAYEEAKASTQIDWSEITDFSSFMDLFAGAPEKNALSEEDRKKIETLQQILQTRELMELNSVSIDDLKDEVSQKEAAYQAALEEAEKHEAEAYKSSFLAPSNEENYDEATAKTERDAAQEIILFAEQELEEAKKKLALKEAMEQVNVRTSLDYDREVAEGKKLFGDLSAYKETIDDVMEDLNGLAYYNLGNPDLSEAEKAALNERLAKDENYQQAIQRLEKIGISEEDARELAWLYRTPDFNTDLLFPATERKESWFDKLVKPLSMGTKQVGTFNENEINDFYYYLAKEGAAAAAQYALNTNNAYQQEYNELAHQRYDQIMDWRAKNYGKFQTTMEALVSPVGTTIMNLAALPEAVRNIVQAGHAGMYVAPTNPTASQMAEWQQQAYTKELAKAYPGFKALDFFYGAYTSTVNSAMMMAMGSSLAAALGITDAIAIGGKGAAELFTSAFTDLAFFGSASASRYRELIQQGIDPEKAATAATYAGAFEAAFEHISIENLYHAKDVETWKSCVDWAWNTLASAGIEGSEELFTNWANRLADNIFLGEDSDFNQSLKHYKAEGFSDDQAMRYAMHDILKEDATAFAAGAISSVPNVGIHGAVAFHVDQKEYAKYRAQAGHEYNVDAGNGKKGSQVLGEYLWHYDFIREGDEGSFTEGQQKIADTIKELAIKAAKGTATDEEVGRLTYLADQFDRRAIDDFALENKEWFGQVAPGRLIGLATESLNSLLGPEGAQQYMEAVRANPNARIENDFALGMKKALGDSVDSNKISRVQSILETILRGSDYANEETIKAALETGDLNTPEIQMYVWEYLKGKLPADTPVTEAVQENVAGLTPSKEWADQNVQHVIPTAEQAQATAQAEEVQEPTVIPSADKVGEEKEPTYQPETDRFRPIIQTIGMDPNVNQDNVKDALQSVLGSAWKKSRDAMYQFRVRQNALSEANRKLAKMQAEDSKAAATEAMAKTPEKESTKIAEYRDKNDSITLSGKTMTRAEFVAEYKKGINGFTGREVTGKHTAKEANIAFDNMLLNSTKQDGLTVEGVSASMVKYDLSTRDPLAKTGEKKADQQQEPKAPKAKETPAEETKEPVKPQVEERKESGEAKAEENAPTPVTYTYEGYTYEATKNGYVVRDPSGEEIGTATNRVDAAELIRVAIASKAPPPAAEAPATVIPTAETPAETAPVEEKKPVSIPSKEQADAKSEAAKKAIEQAKEDARREAKEKAIEKAMATYESKKKKAEDALQKEEDAKVAADEAKARADAIEESNTKEKADANEAADKAREEAKKAHKKAVTAQREARKAMEAADVLLAENETEAPTAETPEVQAEQAPETAPEEVAEEKVEPPAAEVQEAVEAAVSDDNLTATDAGTDTSWRTWKDEAADPASGDTVTREEFVKREMEGVDGFSGVMKTKPKTAAQANDLFDDFLDQAEDNEQTNFYDYNYKGPVFSTAVNGGTQTSAPINIPTVTAEQVPGMVNLSEVGYNSENRTIGASSRSWDDAIPAANGSTITRAQFVAAAMSGKNAYSGGDMRVMSGVAANDLFDDIVDSKIMNGGFTDTVNGSTKVSDPIITSGMTEVPGIVGSLAANLAILEAETREAAKARETIAGYQRRVDSARKQLEDAIKTEISESATEVTDARNSLRNRLAEIENRLGVIKSREITNPESALEYEGEVQGLRNERQRLLNQVYNINAAEARYNRALDRLNTARNTMYVNDYYTVIGGSNYEGSAGTSGITGRNDNVGRTGSSGSAAVYAGGSTGNVQGSATGSTRQAFSTPTEILSKNGITLKGEVAFDTAGKTPQQIANDKSIPATLRNSILHAMRNGLGRVIITRGELSNGKTMINDKGKEVPQPIGGFYDTITENGKERAVVVLNQDRLTENNIRHEFVHHMMRKMSNAQKRDFLRSSIQIMFQGREDLFRGVFETYKVDYATAYGRTVDEEGRVDQDLAYKIYEEMVADFYAGIPRFVNNAEFAKAMAPLFTEARIRLTDHFERMGLEDYARAKWTDQAYESESLLDINSFGEARAPYGQEYAEAKPQPRPGTYQADLKNRTITDADTGRTIQYSLGSTEVGTYDLADFSEAQDVDGGPLFQVYAFDHDEPEYKRMLTEWGGMSEQEINNLFQTVDAAMDTIKENLEALDYAWEADIDDRGFLPVKPNSDKLYKVSQDFSTLCRKRLLQMAVQNELQAALNRALTRDEGIAIRNALVAIQEEGKQIEVACALCYVESARMKTPEQIQKFLDNREKVIRDYFASKDKAESKKRIAEADAAERDKIAREHGDENGMVVGKDGNLYDVRDPKATPMNKLPKQWSDQIKVARREAKSQHKFTPEQQRIVDIANSMSISDFTSPKGLENLAKNHRELFDAYTSFVRAAAHSKGIEDDTWWRVGDSATISDRLIEQMNAENGLRTQSWSDFQVKHLMDYVAATIELSTRGAQQHAYTKVPDYVDLMGNTGVMINMSLIPTREFNGTLRYDNVEGFVYDKALALRNKYHETAGTICIGVDNEQIRQLLASDVIDYIIPYHQSGMALHTRIAMNIPTWEDYQNYQNEKQLNVAESQANADKYGVKLLDVNDKNWHNAPKFSDWFDLETARRDVEEVGKSGEYGVMTGGYVAMQRAAEKYKQLCAERGLAPKFSYGKGNFVDQDNYWKLLIDRKMVDNVTGDIIEQKALRPIFDKDVISRILNDELDRYGTVKADQEEAIRRVTQEFLAGNLREGMKLDEIRQVMQKPVDNISIVNITGGESGTAQFSLSQYDGIENAAEEHFGTTNNYTVAGYLLRDGKMLDFSGNHYGGGYGRNDLRVVDHNDVSEAFDLITNRTPPDAAGAFISRGNIRLSPEAPGVNLTAKVEPTPEQYNTLRDFIADRNTDDFYLDIMNSWTNHPVKTTYAKGVNPDKVINDIKAFYRDGTVPQQSTVNQFHGQFSLSTEDIRFSIVHDVVDADGKVYEDVLRLAYPEDTSIFDTRNSMKYYARQYLAGRTIGVRDHDGKQEKITFARRGDEVEKHLNKHAALDELSYGKSSGPLSRLVYLNAEEALEAVDDPKHIPQNPDWWENHEWFDENGWDWYDGWVMDKDNKLYPLTLHVANTRDGRSILYNAYVGIRNPVDIDIEATAENNPNEDFTTTPVLPEKERVGRGSAARPANTQNGAGMYSLNPNFDSQVDDWIEKGRPQGWYLQIGTTSEALKSVGIDDKVIKWPSNSINHSQDLHPEITDQVIKQIPQLLEYPILIMESKTQVNRVTLLGEVYGSNSLPVLAVLELKPTKNGVTVEDLYVVNTYTKNKNKENPDSSGTQALIDASTILYIEPNKNRTNTWLHSNRLQLPFATKYGPIGRISLIDKDVKGNYSFGEDSGETAMEAAFRKAFEKRNNQNDSGVFSLSNANVEYGLNFRDPTGELLDKVFDGSKKYETRNYTDKRGNGKTPKAYLNTPMGIVQTGAGQAKYVGNWELGDPVDGEPKDYQWLSKHAAELGNDGTEFEAKPGDRKWVYPIISAERVDPKEVTSRGIRARRIQFSLSDMDAILDDYLFTPGVDLDVEELRPYFDPYDFAQLQHELDALGLGLTLNNTEENVEEAATEEPEIELPPEERRPSRRVENGEYNPTAYLKPETLDIWLSDSAFASTSKNYAQAYIGWMNPDDFLYLSTGSYESEDQKRAEGYYGDVENISQRAQRGREADTIHLSIDHETGKVTGHEGRHRMDMLQHLGVENIPVLFFDLTNKTSKELMHNPTLTCEWNDRRKITLNTDLIPLNQNNRALIEAEFVNGEGEDQSKPTVRFSLATDAQHEVTVEEVQEARDKWMGLKIAMDEQKEEFDAQTNRAYRGDITLDEYQTWLKESGYEDTHKAAREAWDEYNKLNKLYDAQYDLREEQKERQAITDSGLTEAEYFAKKAVNEFGYTPYFYDAGYIMPNGKMLNFSGEKGKHFGSRGEDHRGIETIFATTRRGKALTRFVNYGNIRIMPEGPGLEISTSVEPTPEQYSKIRDFIRQYQQQGYFGIDLADERGYAVGTLEYENNINPVRIVNDIKTFYRTGEIPQQSTTSQFHGQFSLSVNQDAAFDQFGDELTLDDYNPSVTQSASSENLYYSEDGNTAYYQTDSGETVVLNNVGPDSPEAQYINSLEANNNANSTNTTTTEPHPIPASNRNVNDGYNLREQNAGLRRGQEEVPTQVQEGTLRRAGSTPERNGQSGSQSEETQGVSYGLLLPDDTITPFINKYGDTVTTAETYPYGSMERIMIEAWDNKDFTKMQEQLDELFGDREDRDEILDIAEQINQAHPELTDQQRKATQKLIDELRVLWGTMPSRKNPTRDVHLPTSVDGTTKIMKGAQTIAQEAATEWLSEETMYEALNNEILSYVPTPNAKAIKQAEEYIKAHNGNYDVLAAQVHTWLESGGRVKPWQVAVGELLLKEVETEGKADVAMGLVIDLTLIAHETGQALQAFNILRKATPRGQLYYLQGVVNQLNKQYADKIKDGKMSKVELPAWAASRMLACQTREELNNTVEEIKNAIAKSIPVSWGDRWNAWRYLAMLGNPRTHVRNMLGNAMFSPAVFMKDIIARWIEEHYDSTGRLEGRVKAKNVNLHNDTEWMKMALDDFNVMQKILVGEAVGNKYADANDILSRRDLWGKERWLGGKFLAWADELNSMGLTKEDERFLKKYYTRAFAEFLQARGITEAAIANGSFGASKEDRKLIAEARAWATLEAQRNTYRDANAFAQWVNSMKRKNKTAYVLLEGLMPFTKTPMNILSRGIEYSPIGLIQSIVQLNRDLQSPDKMTTSQAIDRLAAGMTGTMIMGLGLLLSSLGVLRGSGGDDKKKKELEELQGHQAWSVELFGRSYTIDWMAPAALPLFIGSAIHDMLVRDSDEELSFENILLALAGVANPLSQLSMLDGINSMLTNLSNTEGTEQYAVLAWSMLTSYAAQGVPTLLGQVARTFDEDRRSTYIQPGSANPMLQRFIQTSLQGKIPGWENQKMAYVDNWGRKDTNSSFIGRALENFLSPGYYNRIVQTDVDAELERLYAATKDADIIPTKMQKYFQVDGERKNLTADEYENLLTERGQEAYNVLNELMKTPYYDSLSDEGKAKLVADTLQYSENYGKFMTDANYDMASHWMQAAMDIGAVDYMIIKNDLEKNRTHEQLFTYLLSNPNLSLDQISYLVADEYAAPDSIDSVANNGWHYDLNDDDEAAMQDIFKNLLNTRLTELESDPRYINGDANKRGMMLDNLYSEVRDDTKAMYAEQLDNAGRHAELSKSSSIGKDSFGMVLDLTKNDITGDYSDDISAQAAWLGQQYRPDTKIDNPDRNGWAIELSKDDKDELYDAFQKEWDKAYRNLVTNDPEFLSATSREYQDSMIESLCKEIEKKVEDEYASELYKSGKANEVIGTPKGTSKADWISNYAIAKDAFPGDIQAQAEWYAQRFTGASTLDNPDRPGYNIKTSDAQKEELAKREQAEFISKYVALHNDPDFKAMSSDDQDLAVYQLAQNVMDIGEAEYSRYLLDRGAKIEEAVDTQCSNVEYFNMVFSENLTEAERMDMIEQRYDRYVGTSILNHDLDYIMRNHRVDAYMQYVADNLYKIAGLTGQEGADAYIAKVHKPAMDASKKSIRSEYGISGKTTAEAEDERRTAEGYNYGLHVGTNMNAVRPQASTNTPPVATRSSSGTTKASATTDATKPKSNSGYVIPPANQMSDSLKYRPNW